MTASREIPPLRTHLVPLLLLAAAIPALAEDAPVTPPAAAAAPQVAGFQVIVNAANPAESVSHRQLADVFLKKQTTWPDGSAIAPVEPPEKSRAKTYFLYDVMNGRSAMALKAFWQKKAASGHTPPVEKATEEAVVAFVKANPGAIGYVAPATAVPGVKVLPIKD